MTLFGNFRLNNCIHVPAPANVVQVIEGELGDENRATLYVDFDVVCIG